MMMHSVSLNEALLLHEQHLNAAKKVLSPACHVCKSCNGSACAGHVTNTLEFGAKGNNGGFIHSVKALARIRIELDPIHEDFLPDTSCEFFGHSFDLPVFASPIGQLLTDRPIQSPFFNTNHAYAAAVVNGCYLAGGMAWVGDNKEPGYFSGQVEPIGAIGGVGVPTIKPWADREQFWDRVRLAQAAHAMAVATDVDAIGLGYQYSNEEYGAAAGVSARSVADLKEITRRVRCPVVIKGVLSVSAALKCQEAGAYGILISNHGGNIVENSLAPCEAVMRIRKAVGPKMKIFVDGGVRSGEDVFKLLALGADAVGIGRPYAISVYGGGQEGAYIYTQKIYHELHCIMRLAGCRSLRDITSDKVILPSGFPDD